jgi:hypothetical protein
MDVIVERPSALDVHKATVMACVRVSDEHGVRVPHLAEFQTTVRGLLALLCLASRFFAHSLVESLGLLAVLTQAA